MTNQGIKNPPGTRLLCHKCAYIKSPAELVNYGKYRLRLDCARKYENLKEKDRIDNMEAFVIVDLTGVFKNNEITLTGSSNGHNTKRTKRKI